MDNSTAIFISKAKEVHGNKYDYCRTLYINSTTKIKIICLLHGEFEQFPCNHLSGNNCPKCFKNNQKNLIHEKHKKNFMEKAKEKYGAKYDYSKVNYINSSSLITIICPVHGEFEQSPRRHLIGKTGCKLCGLKKGSDSIKLLTGDFIERGIALYGNKYIYDKVQYVNMQTDVMIECRQHGPFKQRPDNHLNGHIGCNLCVPSNYSQSAIKWLKYLEMKHHICIQHAENEKEYNIPETKYKVDGYCHENNTVYEFNGCFFHGCPICYDENNINPITKKINREQYEKTLKKEQIIISSGYQLVTIWEHEWKTIKNEVEKYLNTPKIKITLKPKMN